MLYRNLLLAAGLLAAGGLKASTPTFTLTVTPTSTITKTSTPGTATPTTSPTLTNTIVLPITPQPSATASPTISQTFSASPTHSPSPSVTRTQTIAFPTATPTLSATPAAPTAVPTNTPPALSPVPSPNIDNFDDGDTTGSSGGTSLAEVDSLGSTMTLGFAGGSDYSGSASALHCGGTIVQDAANCHARLVCQFLPGGSWAYLPAAAPDHAITFSYKGDTPGVQIEFGVRTGAGDSYSYTFTLADTAWHTLTVYFPDVDDPSLTPRLQPSAGAPAWSTAVFDIRDAAFSVVPSAGGPQTYGFAVDDLRLGEPRSASSPVQLSTALGVPVAQVEDAYNFNLDERLTWAVLRLAAHCGCHPSQILQMRETRSWGQIAIEVGTTWAVIQSELDAAGLDDAILVPSNMERSLLNGPLPTPGVRAQLYVPVSDYVLPTPTGGCP
jgi:hypothetical protein